MLETTARALKKLGFRDGETRRALDVLETRFGAAGAVSEAAVIREALAILT